ncbi:hypothetical protein PW5551_03180 [Petrotoga sp. 9PW.55.5.1]|uniref:hypothetical protein n=1 Tax=Petrotoga sp. 9PW.55.5.1 TaxID=1308979 RepID=UPI000DC5AA7E|nr:hypothetical protein [Petrotoga sp. 9PW.55.5.1]RAO99505.1 hypothetical protein PW5551_03180 [Petrotoga sp. 9PW.55.5.1]
MFKKPIFLCLVTIFSFSLIFSLNLELSAEGFYEEDKLTDRLGVTLYYTTSNFDIMSDIAFYNDDKYHFYEEDYYWGHYFLIENSYITLRNYDGTISLSGGIKDLKDEINSPYSLFFSSEKISQPYFEFSYENDNFFFETMWVQLVSKNNGNFPDSTSSMNYKLYGLKVGDFRVGYQDVLVYERAFDYYYLLNPMPAYFAQEFRSSSNNMPWSEDDSNDNSIMGFFFDYNDPNYYLYSQLLVDDFNTNRFFNPEGTQNPDKVAFSSGFNVKSNIGTFGLHGAFATRYTFQRGGGPGYTIYPENTYNGETIDYTDNYIGYKYGENTVSFLMDYDYTLDNWFNIYSSFETILSGSKSPTKKTAPNSGTYLLDEDKLEKRYIYTLATKFFFKNIELNLSTNMGVIQNKLELDEEKNEFVPSDEEKNIIRLNFGIAIKF